MPAAEVHGAALGYDQKADEPTTAPHRQDTGTPHRLPGHGAPPRRGDEWVWPSAAAGLADVVGKLLSRPEQHGIVGVLGEQCGEARKVTAEFHDGLLHADVRIVGALLENLVEARQQVDLPALVHSEQQRPLAAVGANRLLVDPPFPAARDVSTADPCQGP